MKVSWDHYSQYMESLIKFHGSSHHQPVMFSLASSWMNLSTGVFSSISQKESTNDTRCRLGPGSGITASMASTIRPMETVHPNG